jgi:hypothetical protein
MGFPHKRKKLLARLCQLYRHIFLHQRTTLPFSPCHTNATDFSCTHLYFYVSILDKIFSGSKPCQLWIKALVISLMMKAEMVSKTFGFYPQLTRLVAQENCIE